MEKATKEEKIAIITTREVRHKFINEIPEAERLKFVHISRRTDLLGRRFTGYKELRGCFALKDYQEIKRLLPSRLEV